MVRRSNYADAGTDSGEDQTLAEGICLFSAAAPSNRKSGPQIVDYLNHRYSLKKIYSDEWKEVVSFNVLNNQHNKAKLPEGKSPHPMIFMIMRRQCWTAAL